MFIYSISEHKASLLIFILLFLVLDILAHLIRPFLLLLIIFIIIFMIFHLKSKCVLLPILLPLYVFSILILLGCYLMIFQRILHWSFSIVFLFFFYTVSRSFHSISLNGPVKDKVVLKSTLVIQLFENTLQIGVVRSLLKFQLSTIIEENSHFFWIPCT